MPELGVGFESGLGLEDHSAWLKWIIFNHKVDLMTMGPSDHSDWVTIHRLSNKKAYTERVDCSPADILLSEIEWINCNFEILPWSLHLTPKNLF